MVRSAHGVFPVPAPATVRLLADAPVYSSGVQMETVTPTGALLVTGYAAAFGPLPAMRSSGSATAPATATSRGRPTCCGCSSARTGSRRPGERVVVIECEIDDMNPQIFGALMDRLYAAGALEVFYTAVQMKKNRPGTLLTVVAAPEPARGAVGHRLSRNDDDWATLPGGGRDLPGA